MTLSQERVIAFEVQNEGFLGYYYLWLGLFQGDPYKVTSDRIYVNMTETDLNALNPLLLLGVWEVQY